MKSFDEVTKALSICGRHPDCKGCPYENVSYPTAIGNTCKDIMHYDALFYMQDRIDECQETNSPLTWEELKAMKDKPVWIELLGNGHWKGWDVIAGFDEDDFGVAMVTIHDDDYYKLDLGKTWQAYRKERK